MKAKNISIKKITQRDQSLHDNARKSRNSRKSLRGHTKQLNDTKPSPITLMKKDTFHEDQDSEQTNSDNFIECINGYLNQLDVPTAGTCEIKKIKGKIEKQKMINRNLQKNIIQFQRILFQRTEKIERIQQTLKKMENKQNERDFTNQIQLRKRIAKQISQNNTQLCSETSEDQEKCYSRSRVLPEYCYEKSKRRRTEVPAELQKMISKTIQMKQNKKGTNRFF